MACMMTSLTHAPPLVVCESTFATFALSLEKKYSARGFSRALMNAIASSIESTATMGRIGPKISSHIIRDCCVHNSVTIILYMMNF